MLGIWSNFRDRVELRLFSVSSADLLEFSIQAGSWILAHCLKDWKPQTYVASLLDTKMKKIVSFKEFFKFLYIDFVSIELI